MANKNAFIAEQHRKMLEAANNGMRHGEQYCIDCVEIALHERFGWGYDRIKKLIDAVTEIADYYAPSMQKSNIEQPIYQERFDNALLAFIGERQEFAPFASRYPLITEQRYDKPFKG